MKLRPFIQFKATFLTIVFLLNTVVGFACAVGVSMSVDKGHHPDQNASHSIEHGHEKKKCQHHGNDKHAEGVANHHTSKNLKDNCCKDEVVKLVKANTLHQPGFDYSLLSLSFFILPSNVYHVQNSTVFPVNTPNAYIIRHCRLPIPDVRIAIQSFQI
ncbi:hypothetical protein ACVWYG_001300 [Pedobacter sp. UYEF25]